jgi:hypothetical protein
MSGIVVLVYSEKPKIKETAPCRTPFINCYLRTSILLIIKNRQLPWLPDKHAIQGIVITNHQVTAG